MKQEAIETAAASAASKAIGVGSGVTMFSWLTNSSTGMWAGIVIGVAGLLVNWYYKWHSNARAAEAHRMRMRAIEAGIRARDIDRMGKPHDGHEADE